MIWVYPYFRKHPYIFFSHLAKKKLFFKRFFGCYCEMHGLGCCQKVFKDWLCDVGSGFYHMGWKNLQQQKATGENQANFRRQGCFDFESMFKCLIRSFYHDFSCKSLVPFGFHILFHGSCKSKTKQRMVFRMIHVKDSLLPLGKVWSLDFLGGYLILFLFASQATVPPLWPSFMFAIILADSACRLDENRGELKEINYQILGFVSSGDFLLSIMVFITMNTHPWWENMLLGSLFPSASVAFRKSLRIQQLKRGRFFALVACDVHHCGFVTGAGLAVGREDAKQLAAKQVVLGGDAWEGLSRWCFHRLGCHRLIIFGIFVGKKPMQKYGNLPANKNAFFGLCHQQPWGCDYGILHRWQVYGDQRLSVLVSDTRSPAQSLGFSHVPFPIHLLNCSPNKLRWHHGTWK